MRWGRSDYFEKKGVSAKDWNIDFYDEHKISQGVLSSLKKGRSRFTLIITGKFHSHSIPQSKITNIFTELNKGDYVDHRKGSEDPRKELTSHKLLEVVDMYVEEKHALDRNKNPSNKAIQRTSYSRR